MGMRTIVVLLFCICFIEPHFSFGGPKGWWNWRRGGEGEGECWKGHNHGPHGEGEGETGHDHGDHCGNPGPFFCGSLFRYVTVNKNVVSIAKKRWRQSDVLTSFTLNSITERTTTGAQAGTGALGAVGSHSFSFASTAPISTYNHQSTFQGLNVCQTTVTFPLTSAGMVANVTVDIILFSSNGQITDGPFIREVTPGTVKFVITAVTWPWCTPVSADPNCGGRTGSYLDLQVTSNFPFSCTKCQSDPTLFYGGCGMYMILPQDVIIDGIRWSTQISPYPTLTGSLIKSELPYGAQSVSWSPIITVAQPFSFFRPSCPARRVPSSSAGRAASSSAALSFFSSSAPTQVIPSSSNPFVPPPVSSSALPVASSSNPLAVGGSSSAGVFGGSSSDAAVFIPSSSAPFVPPPASSSAAVVITPSSSAPFVPPPVSSSAPFVPPPVSSSGLAVSSSASVIPPPPFSSSATVIPPTPSSSASFIPPSPSSSAPFIPSPSSSASFIPPSPSSSAPFIPPSPSSSASFIPPSPSSSASFIPPSPSSSAASNGVSSQPFQGFSSSAPDMGMMGSSSSSSGSDGGDCDPQDDPNYQPFEQICNSCGCFLPCNTSALPRLNKFVPPPTMFDESECQVPNSIVPAGTLCHVDCPDGFVSQGFWTCINGNWAPSNYSVPCSPQRYAVFNITAGNATNSCGVITEDESNSQVYIRTCAGGGNHNLEVQLAIFPNDVPTLPDEFIGNPSAPFTVDIANQNQMPSDSYLNVSLCRSDFLPPPPPLRLYQSEDYGQTWKSTAEVCQELMINVDTTPHYTALDPNLNVACWSFPICHTTLFIMGPVAPEPDNAPTDIIRNHNSGYMWLWILSAVGGCVVITLICAAVRKCLGVESHKHNSSNYTDIMSSNYVMLDDTEGDGHTARKSSTPTETD